MSTITIKINGQEVQAKPGQTVLQVCESVGIEVPRFCYHDRLSLAGNCRMCLVEIKPGPPKPSSACTMPVGPGMEITTDSEKVRKARRDVMELILINHPLDCPICDQGGECDLQDQAVTYGADRSHFHEDKIAVCKKTVGPLINMTMTRCIQCTRCVRFAQEIAGVPVLGKYHRGEMSEIGTYVEATFNSEISGCLVDLCPVGALTSASYMYTARAWELRKTESIDVSDALGANIRVDSRGNQVLRIQPRINDDVNEEWLSDKGRFAVDGLLRQRLDTPYVRRGARLEKATWKEAFARIAEVVGKSDGKRMAALAGDQADCESMVALKDLMTELKSPHMDCRQDGGAADPKVRASYIFNSGVAGIDQADAILLVGTNPRWENPVINARIRKRYMAGGVSIAAVGPRVDLTYPHQHLGDGPTVLKEILSGKHAFSKVLKDAAKPMIIVGAGALSRGDGEAVLGAVRALAEKVGAVSEDWNGFNVLQAVASRVGGLDLGFVPGKNGRDFNGILEGASEGQFDVVYLLGVDEIDMNRLGPKAFVIYQGHHGDAGAHRADVVLPGAAPTEKNATFVNTEGRVQQTNLAVFPPGEAKEDWTILRALSEVLGHTLPYDTLAQVRERLVKADKAFGEVGEAKAAKWGEFGGDPATMDAAPFQSPIKNFYMTDPITRASAVMAECTAVFVKGKQGKTGTNG